MLVHFPRIVTDGLVLCLDAGNPLSYTSGDSVWKDLSGNGNNGTLVNGVGYNNSNKGSLVFDGVDDYINVGKNATQLGIYDTSYTMMAFFKVSNLTGDKMVFGTDQAAGRKGMHHGVRNSTFYFGHYGSDASGGTVVVDRWYHGTWIWTSVSPTARIYIDGILVGSSGASSFIGDTNILISRSFVRHHNMNIAQTLIYDKALTPQEMQNNYLATKGRYGL